MTPFENTAKGTAKVEEGYHAEVTTKDRLTTLTVVEGPGAVISDSNTYSNG